MYCMVEVYLKFNSDRNKVQCKDFFKLLLGHFFYVSELFLIDLVICSLYNMIHVECWNVLFHDMHDFFIIIHLKRKQKKNIFSTVLMIFNLMTFANCQNAKIWICQHFENYKRRKKWEAKSNRMTLNFGILILLRSTVI